MISIHFHDFIYRFLIILTLIQFWRFVPKSEIMAISMVKFSFYVFRVLW